MPGIKVFDAFIDLELSLDTMEREMRVAQRKSDIFAGALERDFGRRVPLATKRAEKGFISLGQALPIVAVALLGKKLVQMAADAEEATNLFQVAMAELTGEAKDFAREYARSMRLSVHETESMLGKFQLVIEGLGIGKREAFEMSKVLTERTLDIASLRNLKMETAVRGVIGALTKEREILKQRGIVITEELVKEEALRIGLIKEGEALDVATNARATFALLLRLTEKDAGDMARTLDELTNKQRQSSAAWRDLGRTIGGTFKTAAKDAAGATARLARALDDIVAPKAPEAFDLPTIYKKEDLEALNKANRGIITWQRKFFAATGGVFSIFAQGERNPFLERAPQLTPAAIRAATTGAEARRAELKEERFTARLSAARDLDRMISEETTGKQLLVQAQLELQTQIEGTLLAMSKEEGARGFAARALQQELRATGFQFESVSQASSILNSAVKALIPELKLLGEAAEFAQRAQFETTLDRFGRLLPRTEARFSSATGRNRSFPGPGARFERLMEARGALFDVNALERELGGLPTGFERTRGRAVESIGALAPEFFGPNFQKLFEDRGTAEERQIAKLEEIRKELDTLPGETARALAEVTTPAA